LRIKIKNKTKKSYFQFFNDKKKVKKEKKEKKRKCEALFGMKYMCVVMVMAWQW